MYADHTMLQITGQVVMGGFFIFQGVKNVSKWQFNMDRTTALGLPLPPALVLIAGFTIQFAGAAMVLDSDAHGPADLLTRDFATKVARGAGLSEQEARELLDTAPRHLLKKLQVQEH